MEILDEIKKSYVTLLLNRGERADKRGWFDYRPIEVKKNVIDTAEGSAWVRIGNTQVLAAVKFQLDKPFPDRPDEGILSTNAELLPMANPRFEPGPPDERAIELARVVDRGIRSSEIIDLKSLFIEKDKVYGLYIDLYVLDYDGNYFDASALATMAALTCTTVPPYKDGALAMKEKGQPLKLNGTALEFTFVKIGEHIILDPSLDEEYSQDARITIGICGDKVCTLQKNGRGAFKKSELGMMIDVAFEKYKEMCKYL